MNSRNLIGILIALVILAGLGFWYFSNQQSSTTPEALMESTPSTDVIEEEKATDFSIGEDVKEITVESTGLKFTPSEIRVKKGNKIKLTYKNNNGTHDWTLDEFSVKTKLLSAGGSETLEFIADKEGEFEFYCSVPGHRLAGMKGKFIVE